MSIRRLKRCFVPTCENTSENNKNKLFILLPSKPEIRKKWFTSINGKYITKTDLYACEDHFDLKNDMKNWVEYKLLAKRMFMKESAVPRFFINSPIPEKQKFVSQISDSERKRKREAMERYTEQVRRLAKRENNFNNENPDTRLIGNIGLSKKDYFVVLQPAINSDVDETLPTTSSANDTEVSKLFLVPEAFSPSINIVISAVPDHVDPPSASLRSVKMKQMLSSAENCYFDMTKPPSRSITTTNFTSYTAGRVPPIPSPISDKFKMNISHKLFDKEAKIKQELQEGVTIKFESVDIDETDLETDNKIDIRETCLAPIQEKVFKVDGYNEQFNDVEELKFMNTVSVNCDDHNLENIPGIQDEGFEIVREIIDEENELKQESYDNIDIKNEMDEVVTEYIFACSVCNEMYETKEELIEHKIETAECHEHKQCEKCGIKSEEGFACIWDLMQHMEAEHKVEHLDDLELLEIQKAIDKEKTSVI
ncbi:unnamed protein product [Phaedon cochleariae]|uniref:THAP-type domain-containing protein n=1 Tax=Phaedon cochleariae TaxID=80249 RepID=A0A9P0GPV2_PHACE|nr:unnamed protein product [Phaedon cochleariae]